MEIAKYFAQKRRRSLDEIIKDLGENRVREVIFHPFMLKLVENNQIFFEYSDMEHLNQKDREEIEKMMEALRRDGIDPTIYNWALVSKKSKIEGKGVKVYEVKPLDEIPSLRKYL